MHAQPTSTHRGVSQLRTTVGAVILGLVLGVLYLVEFNKVEYFEVTAASMEPAIQVGDRLIMSPARRLRRGDIVVFKKPEQSEDPLVKRIVALAPDHVDIRDGQIFVNGVRDDPPQGPAESGPQPDRSWDLKPGEAFVAGDNRPVSIDSRDYGPIAIKSIRGLVTYRVSPTERSGFIRDN